MAAITSDILHKPFRVRETVLFGVQRGEDKGRHVPHIPFAMDTSTEAVSIPVRLTPLYIFEYFNRQ